MSMGMAGWTFIFATGCPEPALPKPRRVAFRGVTTAAGLAEGPRLSTGAVLVDVDGDGRLDLLVNSIGAGTRLYRNRGDGRFEEDRQSGLRASGGSTFIALADTDGDGDLDLYVANYRTSTIVDQPGVRFTLSKVEGRLVVTRVNGVPSDSPEMRDRFVVGPNGNPREAGEADVFYLNDGKGHFTEVASTVSTLEADGKPLVNAPFDWGLTVMFRDLDHDGWPDLYVCNDADSPDRVWINDRAGRFSRADGDRAAAYAAVLDGARCGRREPRRFGRSHRRGHAGAAA